MKKLNKIITAMIPLTLAGIRLIMPRRLYDPNLRGKEKLNQLFGIRLK